MKKYMMTTVASMFLIGVGISNAAYAVEREKTVTQISLTSTKEEIMAFQKARGLKADGIIGPKTRAAMREETPQVVPAPKKAVTKKPPAVVADRNNPYNKCQFLFWEVECNNNTDKNETNITPAKQHVKKGLEMVGMDARKDRKELTVLFEKNLGQRVDPVHIPWCAAWTNMVLAESGIEGTDSLMARSFLNWGHAIREPKQGDIVVLRRGRNKYAGHVGFFIQTIELNGQKYVAVLGGNQNKGVSIAYYPESKVLGYRTAAS